MSIHKSWVFRSINSLVLIASMFWAYKDNLRYTTYDEMKLALEIVHSFHDRHLGYPELTNSPYRVKTLWRDLKKFYHPETVQEDYFIYRMQMVRDTIRTCIHQNFFDSQPFHRVWQGAPLKEHKDKTYSDFTSLWISAFAHYRKGNYEKYGLFEVVQHLPVPQEMYDKISLAINMNARIVMLEGQNKSKQCLRDAQFQKKSYVLDNPEDCVRFFEKANLEYNNNSTKEVYNYVKKNNMHDQKGTELAFKAVFNQVAELYKQGETCLENNKHKLIMQEYINNPVLFNGRKFDIRLHMIIVSTNPPIMYLYKKFYLMKCAYLFDHNEFKNQSHICSAGYQRKLHAKLLKENNQAEIAKVLPTTELTEAVTYEEFANRLIKEGKVKDQSWIQSYMIPEMEKRFHHYLQSYFDKAGQIEDLRAGEYNACEFNVDDNLNFWLLECTTNPNMIPGGPGTMMSFQSQLHRDGLPIIAAYSRQKYVRIKRLIADYMAKLIKQKGTKLIYTKLYKEVHDRVEEAMKMEDIIDKRYDDVFHRIDFKRAAKTCE